MSSSARMVTAVRSYVTSSHMIRAIKMAVAATLAWVLVLPIGGVADQYPYYAPLGAVVSVAGTVAGSFRATVSSIVAIALGAIPAGLALALPVPEVLALAVVVWAGALLAGWGAIGPMASWIPISGLFILILGQGSALAYTLAYVGLVGLGALLGLAVDLLWPALPLHATARSQQSLREALAAQLEDLAEGLGQETLPTSEEWGERERRIDSHSDEMHQLVEEAREAQRANWRAKRWQDLADREYRQARALEQLSFLVEEVYDLVTRTERADLEQVALGPELRPAAVRALQTMAKALAHEGDAVADRDAWLEARVATDDLAKAIRDRQFYTSAEFFVAGSVVTALRRALVAMMPQPEGDDEE